MAKLLKDFRREILVGASRAPLCFRVDFAPLTPFEAQIAMASARSLRDLALRAQIQSLQVPEMRCSPPH